MKRSIRYAILSFLFASCFWCFASVIGAAGNTQMNVYDYIGDFAVESIGTASFNERSSNHNYTFNYDYKITDIGPGRDNFINDGSAWIITYYGFSYAPGKEYIITYENIPDPVGMEVIDDFHIYRYNVINQEFEKLASSGKNPKNGTYKITQPGIYKLDTLISGVGGNATYIIYEPYTLDLDFKEVPYTVSKENGVAEITLNLSIRELSVMNSCYSDLSIKLGTNLISSTCTLTQSPYVDSFVGYYDMTIKFTTYEEYVDEDLIIKYNGKETETRLVYDLKAPVIEEFYYYNPSLPYDDFKINANSNNIVGFNSVASIKLSDDSGVDAVNLIYRANEQNNIAACSLLDNEASCLIDGSIMSGEVTYEFVDVYGNISTVNHSNVYDDKLLDEGDSLSNYISIENENNTIKIYFDNSKYSDVSKICLFYGDEISSGYECGTEFVIASYYYKGNIVIVAVDEALNFEQYIVENISITNGYEKDNFTYTIYNGESIEVTSYVEELINVACSDNAACREELVVRVKYDELIETLETETVELPTYLEMLNTKFRDSTCVKAKCDKTVELIVDFNIGDLKSSISGYLNYEDIYPYINQQFSYQENVLLEYKKFDITSSSVIASLNGDKLKLNNLIDSDGKQYTGEIHSYFIEYKDRNNVVTKLNNLRYDSIAQTDKFGTYLLECKIKLLKNTTDNITYTDDVYTKSFFVIVELADKDAPVLTLKGKESMNLYQYGAYKEQGVQCDDASSCKTTTTYYYGDKNNQVEKIDTNLIGKYFVKYSAIDGDGNIATEVWRTVNVNSMNSFDTTSIIIVVSIVLVLGAIITIIIVHEVRKSKKIKENGGY